MDEVRGRLFDSSAEFEIPILSGGEKRCRVRFPTDEEWCTRARKGVTIIRSLGRDATTTEAPDAERLDEELFRAIRLDKDGPPFDTAEAAAVISKLERCHVVSVERQGDQFAIRLKVPRGTVTHVLRIPKQSDIMQFSRSAIHHIQHRSHLARRVSLEPSAQLWESVKVSAEGYKNGVPVIHKDVAVTELLVQVQLANDDDPEE